MISTTTADVTALLPLNAAMFNCLNPLDEDDIDADLLDDGPKKPETVFDGTGYGYDTFEKPETSKKKKPVNKTTARKNAAVIEPLDETITDKRRVEFFTRPYVPSDFDKQWTRPKADNDNRKGKHTFPALDEARNNTLMIGPDRAHTLIQNEWAFDILLEVRELMDAAAPKCAWLQHDGHGETDEHGIEDNANPGYGIDAKHDYGPSVKKVKRLWEHGNENEPSKKGEPWNLGTVELMNVVAEPSNNLVKALHLVGGLQMNECNNVSHFRDGKGDWLKFKTKTRGAKGARLHPNVAPDPIDIQDYGGAALPRNKNGELTAGFVAGKTGSSNSVAPDTLDFVPQAGPTHSANDPWAGEIAADKARDDAIVKLSQCRLLVGDQPYDALTQAASGFRIGELCGGRLGNTTDSAKGRNLLQVAIERIIEERGRSFFRPKLAA
jgi:hypothetical protein